MGDKIPPARESHRKNKRAVPDRRSPPLSEGKEATTSDVTPRLYGSRRGGRSTRGQDGALQPARDRIKQ